MFLCDNRVDRGAVLVRFLCVVLLGTVMSGRVSSQEPAWVLDDEVEAGGAYQKAEERESFLPLFKSIAKDKQLPRPYGVTLGGVYNAQEYNLTGGSVSIGGLPVINVTDTRARPEVTAGLVKADVWMLPFMNVFASYSRLHVDTEIILPDRVLSGPISPSTQILDMTFKGDGLNAGLVGAWGWSEFIVNMSYTLSWSDLDGEQAAYTSEQFFNQIWDTRLGFYHNMAAAWIGARWMSTNQEIRGSKGNIDFDIFIDQPVWNLLIGSSINYVEQVSFTMELGIGERLSGTAQVNYRF